MIYDYVKGLYFFVTFSDSEAIEQVRQVNLLTSLQTIENPDKTENSATYEKQDMDDKGARDFPM